MLRTDHANLHRQVNPPPKPTRDDMGDCLNLVNSAPMNVREGKLWAVDLAVDYFEIQAQDSARSEAILKNLNKQIGLIALAEYEEVIRYGKS